MQPSRLGQSSNPLVPQQYHDTSRSPSNVAGGRPIEQLLGRPGGMDWITVPSPHSKANPLSSDVQVDMDGLGHDFASSIPAELCSALQSFGEGMQSGSQAVQCKSDKMGGETTSDGQVGWCHRHDHTVPLLTLTA